MNTANAAGALIGALAAAFAARRGAKKAFMLGLAATVLAVAASGLTADFRLLIALRLIAGASGSVAFVTGGSLAAAAAGDGRSRASVVLGLYFGGGGIGVLVSALVVPALVADSGWRGGWFALGALSFAASLIAALALRCVPQPPSAIADGRKDRGWSTRFMALELIGYGLFGAGYIAYATFIVAYLRGAQAFTPLQVSLFWALLGLASIVAAFAWGPALARLTGGRGATATIAMVTVGAALPLIWGGVVAAYLSAILFGGSFLAVATAVMAFARRAAAPHAWTAAIGALTIAFGIGQCIGPVLGGVLSDGPHGVRTGLFLSVAILALAALVTAFQAEPR
jgi:predicted MFS family arabinose efflux permease